MRTFDDLMYLVNTMQYVDFHGYGMDAPDRLPAGSVVKAWYDDTHHAGSVTREQ